MPQKAATKGKKRLLDSEAQSESQRAHLRKQYIDLRHDTLKHREELITNTDGKFQSKLMKQSEMHEQVLFPSEAIHDLSHLTILTGLGVEQSRRWQISTMKYNADQFIEKIVDESLSLQMIGKVAAKYVMASPAFKSMIGPFTKAMSKTPRQKTERQRDVVSERVSLDKNQERSNEEKTQTDERVDTCLRKLQGLGRVNFFQFCFNPNSFAQTVENIFDVSFLVRQNKAAIEMDKHSIPQTLYLDVPDFGDTMEEDSEGMVNVQAVLKLDIPTYRRLVREHRLLESRAPLLGERAV